MPTAQKFTYYIYYCLLNSEYTRITIECLLSIKGLPNTSSGYNSLNLTL